MSGTSGSVSRGGFSIGDVLRADLESTATDGGLAPGSLYHVTDDDSLALAISDTCFVVFSNDEAWCAPVIDDDALRVMSGSYTGTGAYQLIALPYEPDIIYLWGDTQPVVWRNRTTWHGRSQRLDATASSDQITNEMGRVYERIDAANFGVLPAYSVSGRTYHYTAIRWNGSPNVVETSYIGNQTAGRVLQFTDFTADATTIKRDSSRATVDTHLGTTPEIISTSEGGLVGAVTNTATGVTLGPDVWVNENNGGEFGEGHEITAYRNAGNFTVISYTGDGSGARSLGFAAEFMILAPVTTTGPASVIANATSATGISGEAVSGFVMGADVTVPATYNAAGVEYRVIAMRDSGEAIIPEPVPVPASCGRVNFAEARLTDAISISGACSYEFWGRSLYEGASTYFTPFLMSGNGVDQGTSGWNMGLYTFKRSQFLGWFGSAMRIINGQYLSRDFVAPNNSINRYNMNTGVVQTIGYPVHLVVTHNGTGKWRLYENGKLIKEHNRSMTLEEGLTDGGEGVAHPLHVFGAQIGGTFWAQSGEIYRAQVWNATLTDAQVYGLWDQINGNPATVPPAAGSWDFTTGTLPGGVSGVTAATPIVGRAFMPAFQDGSSIANGVQTAQPNGDVLFNIAVANSYLRMTIAPGTWELRTVANLGTVTTFSCRVSDASGSFSNPNNVNIFSHASVAGVNVDRTDTFTVPPTLNYLHYRFAVGAGGTFTLKAGTLLRRIS